MEANGFINKDGLFTNLGYLFSDQNEHAVKFAVYEDNTKNKFRVKKEFAGSITKIVSQIFDYSNLFNDVSAEIVDYQPERVEIVSFPPVSLREAIMNAVSHADYSLRSSIKIEFFIDRLVITSPGCIFGGMSINDVINGRQMIRNPKLIKILHRFGLIENYGTGIARILEAYSSNKELVKFNTSNSFFETILGNLNFENNKDKITNQTTDQTTSQTVEIKHEKDIESDSISKIIQLINQNKNVTLQEIADKIGLSRSCVKYNINKLKSEHKLVRVGSDYAGYWIVRSEIDNPQHLKELSVDEQKELVNWCKENFSEIQSFNENYTSYGLKHIFEENNYYITNGQFKGAMLKAGFKVKNYDDLNWIFNISQRSKALKSK